MINRSQKIGLWAGPILFGIINYLIPFQELSPDGTAVLACTVWLAVWWMTEAIPIEATALMPIILFPITGAVDIKSTTFPYGNHLVFLYLGGFIIAIAIEKWHLHKRIALNIVHLIGSNPRKVILGFMLATGFMSMWISNTASTLMMLPIALSVIGSLQEDRFFSKSLLLGMAYAASIGGMSTLIGTPPNVVFAAVLKDTFDVEISFFDWMKLAFPFALSLLLITWLYLTRVGFKISSESTGDAGISAQIKALGKISTEEKRVLLIFSITAFCWITRRFLLNPVFPEINDTMIAMIGGLSLFLVPDTKNGKLIEWKNMKQVPWGILLLFGGGLSIANAFVQTDLAVWMGNQLKELNAFNLFFLVLIVAGLVNFLTEVTSNLATASMILPILSALAISIEVHPYYLMIGAIFASSCAFMLPIATPPNAIIFGSEMIRMKDMIRNGFILNLMSILLIAIFVYLIMPVIWEINIEDFIQH